MQTKITLFAACVATKEKWPKGGRLWGRQITLYAGQTGPPACVDVAPNDPARIPQETPKGPLRKSLVPTLSIFFYVNFS